MYLKEAEVKQEYNCFTSEGRKFEFRNITVLVGDQGTGKSTLLRGLQSQSKWLKVTLTPLGQRGVNSLFFDTEHMNPRTRNPELYKEDDSGFGYAEALMSRFKSHGEVLEKFTVGVISKTRNSVLFLDEPEAGLSLRNQFRLWNEIKKASERKCQIVLSTHSLVIIQAAKNVLSLEHDEWMKSEDFISKMQEGSVE